MSLDKADLIVVGAGASGTHTLLALLKDLSCAPRREQPVRIIVIDRDPQFFSGVAYGNRSGRASLTLSTLNRFLPEGERAHFVAWLTSRGTLTHDDAIDQVWVHRHLADITAGRWDALFIPRRLYGDFLADCAGAAMHDARAEGVAEVELENAEVTSIQPTDDRYLVTALDHDGQVAQIDAAAVVLAIGSPPTRRLQIDGAAPEGLIQDVYDPGLDTTLTQLRRRLHDLPMASRRVLVVGGNAAALEVVLASSGILQELRAVITVLSPAGRPHHWRRAGEHEAAELTAIASLRKTVDVGERITAAQLHEAVASDLKAAIVSGTGAAAIHEMVESIPFFLESFRDEDRAALAGRYGLLITRLLRQDCGDAVDVLESCIERGAVVFQTGRYLRCRPEGNHFRVTAMDEFGRDRVLEVSYGAIIGATGFESVSATSAPLIRQMLEAGIVAPSTSDAGLRVDSRFRAAPRLYVMGPLLAGNAHPSMLIWQAESVRRIMEIAPRAASCIARELCVHI